VTSISLDSSDARLLTVMAVHQVHSHDALYPVLLRASPE
jgi:hypothetical protein